tara:strand:+ start:715 stop:1044 length:330 start_codon:yes stop_codon:yes gene_type:complete
MSGLEIFQNGTSLHPDRMGEPVYQIGSKNADGEYDVVVFDGMSKKEAEARLAEMQPKPPKAKPVEKPVAKPEVKPAAKKKQASKPAPKKQVSKPAPKKTKAKKKPSRKR